MKIAVHFGAGAIGRGLVGEALHKSGYQIVFVDTNEELIKQINQNNYYTLIQMQDQKRIKIDHVEVLHAVADRKQVADYIEKASVITTSVMVGNLDKIAGVIGEGLERRWNKKLPLINIMAFENAFRASDKLAEHIRNSNASLAEHLDETARFANTVTDRVVSPVNEDGNSVVVIGKEYEMTVARKELVDYDELPIQGVHYTDEINACMERKLYIGNGGHCCMGYLGSLKGYTFIDECIADQKLYSLVRKEMLEVASVISQKYGTDKKELENYVDYMLNRYKQSSNRDYIARVCRNPIRKLEENDRLMSPAVNAEKMGIDDSILALTIAAVFCYKDEQDEESKTIQEYLLKFGIEKAIEKFTVVNPEMELYKMIIKFYEKIQNGGIWDEIAVSS